MVLPVQYLVSAPSALLSERHGDCLGFELDRINVSLLRSDFKLMYE
jgi:hypothetical protein